MGGQALIVPDWVNVAHHSHTIFDDFNHYVASDQFTAVASNGGGVTVADAVGGIATIDPSGTTVADNDETYLPTTTECFKFAQDKPLYFETRIQFTEAATSAANVMVGVKDAVAANTILDNGAGPAASYSGAVIYKVDGETKWRFETSISTTQTTSNASTTTAGGSSYQRLSILVKSYNATQLEAIPFVDGVQLIDGTTGDPISHLITFSGATEMDAFVGLKQGSTTEESLLCDYILCSQKR